MRLFGSLPGRGLQVERDERPLKPPTVRGRAITVPDEKVAEAKKLMQHHSIDVVSTVTGLSANYLRAIRDEVIRANVPPAP